MKLTVLLLTVFICLNADAQVLKRLADRAKDKMERKAGDKIEKGIDNAVDGKPKAKKTTEQAKDNGNNDSNSGSSADASEPEPAGGSDQITTNKTEQATEKAPALKTYSKYDFIPGDKVIAYEDFSDTEIGDFPVRWNTNASAEVVTLNNKEGKWFKIEKVGVFHPEFITGLPDNFTLEFDLGVNEKWNSYPIGITLVNLPSPEEFSEYGYFFRGSKEHKVFLSFKPAVISSRSKGQSYVTTGKSGSEINNHVDYNTWNNQDKKFAHVSIWRQNQRLRVYLNGEKIWDIPRAFDGAQKYNAITFGTREFYQDEDFYLLNNIRLAVGAPDTRNKLITEGKFVTSGILFDVNSDALKAESYGTIKDVAKVLNENPTVRVKVIGHTDSDGDDQSNLELSKKRAMSVKSSLISEFGIDGSRIETDGKGESEPVDKTGTTAAKANNRRVEFIKL